MTPALRKRHQRIWWFLGFALLIIWGASMASINKNNNQQMPRVDNISKRVNIEVISNDITDSQLIKLTLNEPLASPQILVYLASSEKTITQDSLFLGRIDGKGTYDFSLNVSRSSLQDKIIKGYDGIHQKKLFSVVLND